MPSLTFILLVAAIGALALIPTRRLFTAGWRSGSLAAYFGMLFSLGLLIALTRGRVGFLLPILVLVYIAPFVTARDGIRRLRGRTGGGSSEAGGAGTGGADSRPGGIKNVTPPESRRDGPG